MTAAASTLTSPRGAVDADPGAADPLGPLRQVARAERARGNRGVDLVHPHQGLRGDPPHVLLRHRMDDDAIGAEFDLGDRFVWVRRPRARARLVDTLTGAYLTAGSRSVGPWATLARRRWWRRWTRAPRAPRPRT